MRYRRFCELFLVTLFFDEFSKIEPALAGIIEFPLLWKLGNLEVVEYSEPYLLKEEDLPLESDERKLFPLTGK